MGRESPLVLEWPLSRLRLHEQASLVPELTREELAGFRADVARRGVLVPLEVTKEGVVLDGRARLRVASELGLATLPVLVVSVADELEHMLQAALQRRHLSASQRAALALELDLEALARARAEASARQRANLRQYAEVASLPPRGEKTRERLAELAGVSARTMQAAITVAEADRNLLAQVRRGRLGVEPAARRVRRARRDAQLPEAQPLPKGPFELLYGDPPWQLGHPDGAYAPENHYRTLATPEICALVPPAARRAVLYLWAVNSLLPDALQVIEGWGFTYRTNLVWVKPSIGLGNWARNRHELLLVATRGGYRAPEPEDRPDSVLEAPRGRHSEKPASAYELLERAYPKASKLELFARGKPRPGWATWGNEVVGE